MPGTKTSNGVIKLETFCPLYATGGDSGAPSGVEFEIELSVPAVQTRSQ